MKVDLSRSKADLFRNRVLPDAGILQDALVNGQAATKAALPLPFRPRPAVTCSAHINVLPCQFPML